MCPRALATAAALAVVSSTAAASSMPDAEVNGPVLGVGLAPSVSFDTPVSTGSLGFSVGAPFYGASNNWLPLFDVRYLYPLLKGSQNDGFALSLLVGVVGSTDRDDWWWAGLPVGPELGVAMAYQFTPQLRGRLNLVAGYGPDWWYGERNFGSPSSGVEIGYQFTPQIEGTIGFSGYGDFIGLRIKL